jgi:H+/Na+-translocating ferredoxin:NAD+ oxidoreductase subunit G
MLNFMKQSWLVLLCATAFGLLLAQIYSSWKPLIEANQREKLQRGIRSILADAETIDADTLTIGRGATAEEAVIYQGIDTEGSTVGYVFKAAGTGFQDKLELLVGVGPQLQVFKGIAILFAAETPGFGDAVRDSAIFKCQFVGAPAQDLYVIKAGDRNKTDDLEIVSITGATITSEAVTNIINKRWQTIKPLLNSGS